MLTLNLQTSEFSRKGYDEIPQHPRERLKPLREDIDLRKKTFSDWPKTSPVSPEKLCDNGFYYMGSKDKVQCAFCSIVLSGFSEKDDIHQQHASHSGQCELVQNKKNTEKKAFDSNANVINTQYALYCDRLSSFESWPKTMAQKPEDLAATGLYYKGK